MEREFIMHYNIQRLVLRYQDTKASRAARPMKASTAKGLSRLRAKTFALKMDDIDVTFALRQMLEGQHEKVSVLVQLGVSVLNPGDIRTYRQLKMLRKKAKAGEKGLPTIHEIEDKMTKLKPDNYVKKSGAERARAAMKHATFELMSAVVADKKASLSLVSEDGSLHFQYVKNFVTGSVRVYLLEVDGQDVEAVLPYA